MDKLPGQQLKAAREAQGISRTWVAYRLQLTTSRLAALEEDDYSDMPERVYLHGYWRAYAELVGLDWKSISTPELDGAKWRELQDVRGQPGPGRQLLLVVLLLMMLLGTLIWQWQRELLAEPALLPPSSQNLPAPPVPNWLGPARTGQ